MPVLGPDTKFAPLPPPDAPPPGFLEQAGSAFATATFTGRAVGMYGAAQERAPLAEDPEFNILDHLTPDELDQPRIYGRARSFEDLQTIREQERRYNHALEMTDSGPVNPLLMRLAVGVADPASWVGLGLTGGATTAARIATAVGENALLGGGLTAAQSMFDPHVTAGDVATAAGAAGALGGVFRGAAEMVGHARAPEKIQAIAREAVAPLHDARTTIDGTFGGSASAAENSTRIADELTQQVKAMKFGTKTGDTGLLPMSQELENSDIPIVRYLFAEMYDSGTDHLGVLQGERIAGTSLHTLGLQDHADLVRLEDALNLHYADGKKAGGLPADMTRSEYSTAVGEALANGGRSPHPAVRDAAKTLRDDLLEPYRENVVKSGLRDIPGPPKGDAGYFPHVYQTHIIERGHRDELGRTFTDAVAEHIATTEPQHADFAREIAEEITAKIIRSGMENSGQLPRLSLAARGPLKERTLEIPFDVIKPWLNTSADLVLARYIRSVGPDVRLHQHYGTLNPAEAFDAKVKQQADAIRTAIEADATLTQAAKEKKLAAATAHEKRMIELLHHSFNELRGVRPPNTMSKAGKVAVQAAKAAAFIKIMPFVSLAQIPDLGTTIMREGLVRTFGGMVDTLGMSLRGLKTEALRELQTVGSGLEYRLNSRTDALLGLASEFEAGSALERGIAKTSNLASKYFLLNTITAGTKSIAGGAASTRILDNAAAVAKRVKELSAIRTDLHPAELAKIAAKEVLSPVDLKRMARNRLTPDDFARIGEQQQHFTSHAGVRIANSEKWTDAQAMRAYREAMAAAAESSVITPNATDAPMWAGSEIGKIAAMYQRFMYASYGRISVAIQQHRDANALIAAASLMALGAISLAGRDVATTGKVKDRTGAQWARESIDRSGVAALLFAVENLGAAVGLPTTETLVGHGGEPKGMTIGSRLRAGSFASKGPIEKANPMAGYLSDVSKALGTVKKVAGGGDLTESELHNATKLVPFRQMMGASLLFDQLEHAGARHGWYKPLPPEK